MKEALMEIITRHNKIVDTLNNCDLKVSLADGSKVMAAMSIWHSLACEGHSIVVAARDAGIDCKVNMQSGEIVL